MSDWLSDFVSELSSYTWVIALVLIIGFGLLFLYVIKGSSLKIVECNRLLVNSTDSDGISGMRAFFMTLSTRMGAGNIIGVAIAIIVGGAGSILWMWIFAIFGAALCFAECTLGQLYKSKTEDGTFRGGPSYYINKGLKNPKFAMIFAVVFAVIGMMMGGMEACNLNQSIKMIAPDSVVWVNSIIITLIVFFVISRGLKAISKFLTVAIPIVASIWIIAVVITLIANYQNIPLAIQNIVTSGLNFSGLSGAIVGMLIITGFKRGAFCSEGGTGLVSAISSASNDKHPCVQGYIQSLGVYVDIFVICTATALLLLTCGGTVPGSENDAIKYIADALSTGLLGSLGHGFVAVVLVAITFSTTIGAFLVAESSTKYIFGDDKKASTWVLILFAICVLVLSMQKLDFVWNFADLLIAIVVILNVLVMIKFRKQIRSATEDYSKKRKEGADMPAMKADDLKDVDTVGITEWD